MRKLIEIKDHIEHLYVWKDEIENFNLANLYLFTGYQMNIYFPPSWYACGQQMIAGGSEAVKDGMFDSCPSADKGFKRLSITIPKTKWLWNSLDSELWI